MKKLAIIGALGAALLLSACGERDAQDAVEAMGFTNVQLTGTPWWGCSGQTDSILFNHTFAAKAVNGKSISGVACDSLFKGYTVRITGAR